jgi:F-type H+-transporting ATPase subunit c
VYKLAKIAGMSLVAVLAIATMAFAQDGEAVVEAVKLGAIGSGLTVIGAAYGISRLASAALEGMARQPEVAGNCQTAMIIAAALIEGFTFYALYICSTAVVN